MERSRKHRLPVLLPGLVLILAMLLAACGEADANLGSNGSGSPAPTETPQPIDHPRGDDEVVVKIEHVGGFVPQQYLVTRLPHFLLVGDGRAITQGPQLTIFPPPALPNLQMGTISEEGIQLILEAARDAGLLEGSKEFRLDIVADAATTVFTINAGGETHVVSAYALGAEFDDSSLPEEEREAREKIADFQLKMLDYTSWLPEEELDGEQVVFPIEAIQIVSLPREGFVPDDESFDYGELDWPLETPLAEIGEEYSFIDQARCVVIEGDDLETLLDSLSEANELTTWISDDEEFVLLLRPLLPGETGCGVPTPHL